ncbi:MAG TPA: DUF3099 domain-containing protein [Kineosporiaceae bacterium]|nr:DUF3099 domain-containing protein [Kineosporiaceae bacterium]
MARSDSGDPEVHRITAARRAHSDDQDQRVGRYLLSMLIRTLCFVMIFVVHGIFWLQVVFGIGAIFLPYVAVVFANAGGEPREKLPPTSATTPERPALGGERPGPEGDQPNG